jgi:hypothetical protein
MKSMKLLSGLLALCSAVCAKELFEIDTDALISDECCDLTYARINDVNSKVRAQVHQLVNEDYFKQFKFQLDMNCPFFECQSICFSPGCQLDLDVHSSDYDYDLENSQRDLGDLNEDSFLDSLCPKGNDNQIVEDDEWCEINDRDGVIIDISRNPERFTGYIPTPERNIWGMIYQHHLEGECTIEQQVFYQIISGFHSSVSTHLSNEYYNNETNTWEPNLELFKFKVGEFPERIANIYFNYALVTRAILKLEPFLSDATFNKHNHQNNEKIKSEINSIIQNLPHDLNVFNEDTMFHNREIKDEFRSKFKNVTKLMDCVTCDRCRLWGKIQSTGYATALKILFEDEKTLEHLHKNEIASLFNTFDRLTKSIESIQNFSYLQALKDQEYEQKPTTLDNEDDLIQEIDELEVEPIREDRTEREGKSIEKAFYEEMNAVWGALKFIGSSYINLPGNLRNYMMYKLNIWWNKFVGNSLFDFEKNEEYLHNIVAFTV